MGRVSQNHISGGLLWTPKGLSTITEWHSRKIPNSSDRSVCYLQAHPTPQTLANFDMASTPQPVSIPLSLAVIGLIWVAENLRIEPDNTSRQTHEVTKPADSQISTTDVEKSPSKLKFEKSSSLNNPKED